jgi:hypothetical protein
MHWQFPETKFARTNSLTEQAHHLVSESDEVLLAYEEDNIEHAHQEVVDTYHSAETYLRVLAKEKGEQYVKDLIQQVKKKNQERGYYLF